MKVLRIIFNVTLLFFSHSFHYFNKIEMQHNSFSLKQKILAFILTLLIRSSSFAIFGIISRIEKPMSEDLGFAQSFLGTISFLMYTGRAIGTLYMSIDPAVKLKKTLFEQCVLFIIFVSALPIAGFTNFYPKILIGVSVFLAGFSRAYAIISYFILKEFMGKTKKEQTIVSIWFSTSYVGDMSGIMFVEILLTTFNLSWEVSVLAGLSLFLLFSILLYTLLDEIQVINENEESGSSQILQQFVTSTRRYYRSLSNILHSVCFTGVGVVYYTILMWLPYYFITIGYSMGSGFMTIVFPISFVVGNLLYTYLTAHVIQLKSTGVFNFSLLCIIAIIALVLTRLRNDVQDIPIYCVLIFLVGLLISGPQVKIYSSQIDIRVANSYERNIVVTFNLFIHHLASALVFLGSGYILQNNIYSLFWALQVLTLVCVIAYGLRAYLYPLQFLQKQQNQTSEEHTLQYGQDLDL